MKNSDSLKWVKIHPELELFCYGNVTEDGKLITVSAIVSQVTDNDCTWGTYNGLGGRIKGGRASTVDEAKAAALQSLTPFDSYIYFCDGCRFLAPTEKEQSQMGGSGERQHKPPHWCTKYDKQVKHLGRHPNIVALSDCDVWEPVDRESQDKQLIITSN